MSPPDLAGAPLPGARPNAGPKVEGVPGAPVLIRACGNAAIGAALKVAGLTVVERSARQLSRQGHRPLLAADAGVPLPRPIFWPAGAEIIDAAAADSLAADADAVDVVPGNQIRVHARDATGTMLVTDEASRRRAEDMVFGELLRGDLGFVARHLNKPISFRVTRYLLCRLPITPNQVTLAAAAIALCGAALIASGGRAAMVAGYFLAHVQSVLDGCDGELARVRFQQSAFGEWLDTIVDDGLNLTLAVATGVGLWRASGSSLFLWGGLVTGAMLLIYNVIAYRELVRQGEGGEVLKVKWWFTRGVDLKKVQASGRASPFAILLATLSRRDFFIFAWLVLAVVGLPVVILPYIFLIALGCFVAAIGQLVWRR